MQDVHVKNALQLDFTWAPVKLLGREGTMNNRSYFLYRIPTEVAGPTHMHAEDGCRHN